MVITLKIPVYSQTEIQWVSEIVFNRRLGMQIEYCASEDAQYHICLEEKVLSIRNILFQENRDDVTEYRLPTLPLETLSLKNIASLSSNLSTNSTVPILYGDPSFIVSSDNIQLGIDIIGSIFFMLSRYEEIVNQERDKHDRFPASASIAYKAGFLYRPIVDEYIEVLWECMKMLWPTLERKKKRGQLKVTCDVDAPFDYANLDLSNTLYTLAGDIVKRKHFGLAMWRLTHQTKRLINKIISPFNIYKFDPNYSFEWYMSECEKRNLKATFFFITAHSAGSIDGDYHIDDLKIKKLIKKIVDRGHEVGVHGSYNSYRNPIQIKFERDNLVRLLDELRLPTSVAGNRQHFLRWDALHTPDYLEAAGYEYDTTGGFADMPGFRYGTAHSFPMWSWQNRVPLKIEQQPLIMMECSVLSDKYLNLSHKYEGYELIKMLRKNSLQYNGTYTILWHNSSLSTLEDRELFLKILTNSEF